MYASTTKSFSIASLIAVGSLLATQSAAQSAACEYLINNDWGSGATASVQITNTGSDTIEGWNVSWAYDSNEITSHWNANVSGSNPYSASNLSWNDTLAPGQSISFGLQVNTNGAAEIPEVSGDICGNSPPSDSSSSASSASSRSSSSPASSSSQFSTSSISGGEITLQENQTGFCGVDGSVDSDNAGFTGEGFANTDNANGNAVRYRVNAPSDGSYLLELRYASANDRPAIAVVNGSTAGSVSFPSTGGWTSWTVDTRTVHLSAGDNHISIVAANGEGLPNIDSLIIVGNNPAAADCSNQSSSSSSSTDSAPLLPQEGNPVHDRFQSARTEWSQSRADIILSHQYDNGGWPKNQEYDSMGDGGDGLGTIDNGATVTEMVYLAEVYRNTGDTRYRNAVREAMDYLLEAQYSTGGWPQFYPLRGGYSDHVTFNDNAMSSVLTVLHHANQQSAPFDTDIFNDNDRSKMRQAIDRGVDYILNAQWVQNGHLTVWCAQHGKNDYQPKMARAYELKSLSGSESVEVVGFLMTQPQTPEIEAAVRAAINWFRSPDTYVDNYTYDKSVEEKIVYSEGDRMWYRFYDLYTNRGFFSDRDSRKVYDIMDISAERRNGYSWGGNYGEKIIPYAEQVGY
ncbi:pectate lyase [Marinimicrobium locisalis]|uniref:pectate lyase n=1 Tax=Marinimicrobium locisalis TaxID=546022 RepID=UPI00322166C9